MALEWCQSTCQKLSILSHFITFYPNTRVICNLINSSETFECVSVNWDNGIKFSGLSGLHRAAVLLFDNKEEHGAGRNTDNVKTPFQSFKYRNKQFNKLVIPIVTEELTKFSDQKACYSFPQKYNASRIQDPEAMKWTGRNCWQFALMH